jgi:hypothetical protein
MNFAKNWTLLYRTALYCNPSDMELYIEKTNSTDAREILIKLLRILSSNMDLK